MHSAEFVMERVIDPLSIVREYLDAFNTGDEPRFREVLTEHTTQHTVYAERVVRGGEEIASDAWTWRFSFPDAHFEILNIVAVSHQVVCELLFTGTHERPFITSSGVVVPPSGRRVSWRLCSLFQVRDGTIANITVYADRARLQYQLGALPAVNREGEKPCMIDVLL